MIYKSIADRLRLRLNSSDFEVGSPLPGEKKLAEEFGVARMTIRKAIDLLVAWGLVVRRHGSGTYVARKDLHHETTNLTGLAEVLRKQGKEVISRVLVFEVMPAPPAIASLLRIQIDERIYFSRRVRYVGWQAAHARRQLYAGKAVSQSVAGASGGIEVRLHREGVRVNHQR